MMDGGTCGSQVGWSVVERSKNLMKIQEPIV
jgi:hypothetical protein